MTPESTNESTNTKVKQYREVARPKIDHVPLVCTVYTNTNIMTSNNTQNTPINLYIKTKQEIRTRQRQLQNSIAYAEPWGPPRGPPQGQSTHDNTPKNKKSKPVTILQLNCKHSSNVMSTAQVINSRIDNPWIMLIQEGYRSKQGKPTGVGKQAQAFSAIPNSRTDIYASRNLNIWHAAKYSDRDITSCIWQTGDQKIYISSVYMSQGQDLKTITPIPPLALKLIEHCQANQIPLIMGSDTNAHSTVWGSDKTNKRGEMVEDFLLTTGLRFLNEGLEYTFSSPVGESIIDLSLITPDLKPRCSGWKHTEANYTSDHKCLEYQFEAGHLPSIPIRNLKKMSWETYKDTLEKSTPDEAYPENWTPDLIEEWMTRIYGQIDEALDKQCPKHTPGKAAPITWWTEELTELKSELRKARKAAEGTKDPGKQAEHRRIKKKYDKLVPKTRRKDWQQSTSDTADLAGMAKLTRTLKGGDHNAIGLLKRPDKTYASDPKETLDILMSEHFPDSVEVTETDENDPPQNAHPADLNHNTPLEDLAWINDDLVEKAMKSFTKHKAAGPDGLQPIMLHNLPDNLRKDLTTIYKACLSTGYTPKEWRKSKTIFIPKPGKTDYTEPRAYRPISLTSFLFKTLERLVYWHLEDTTLKTHPLSKQQHAFRRGFSTETALSRVINRLEKAVFNGKLAIGVFLDIKGAFDNLSLEGALKGMDEHHFPPLVKRWYGNYLKDRTCIADLKGQSSTRQLKKGTPQGGVLSPLIWNLAMDILLAKLENHRVLSTGFADDLSLIQDGDDQQTILSMLQPAINEATQWGVQNGLTFSPQKTQIVIFTRKRKVDKSKQLKVDGIAVEYIDSAKYLGITLDKELNFKAHIKEKLKQAKKLLYMLKSAFGVFWGPRPELMRWAYTAIVRPAFTFGSFVWAKQS
jgi:retron-type reverse transcriptase